MNGYFGDDPLPDPMWNWNAWIDPLACQKVAQTLPATWIPLDVTQSLTLYPAGGDSLYARLMRSDRRLMAAVRDFGEAWLSEQRSLTFHDPLAALAITHPELFVFEPGRVTVNAEDGATSFIPDREGPHRVARSVDKERVYTLMAQTLFE